MILLTALPLDTNKYLLLGVPVRLKMFGRFRVPVGSYMVLLHTVVLIAVVD